MPAFFEFLLERFENARSQSLLLLSGTFLVIIMMWYTDAELIAVLGQALKHTHMKISREREQALAGKIAHCNE